MRWDRFRLRVMCAALMAWSCTTSREQSDGGFVLGGDAGFTLDAGQFDAPEGGRPSSDASAAVSDAGLPTDATTLDDADAVVSPVSDANVEAGAQLTLEDLPYARSVESFVPGPNAGFGQAKLPDVVLGPPKGKGPLAGSLDVVSLGVGGEIVLGFGEREIVDGPGVDFVVFENPFWPSGDPTAVFYELGEVSVSSDGKTWHTFACDEAGTADKRFVGCAGWTPSEAYDPFLLLPLDPEESGGDAFDLAQLGLERARYVRIRDLSTSGEGTTAGFDLDAVGLVHFAELAP